MTKRQTEVLRFIADFIAAKRYSPSFEEIAAGLGVRSISTVNTHIAALEWQGHLKRAFNQSRSIQVTPKGKRALQQPKVSVSGKFFLSLITERGQLERAGEVTEFPAAWQEALKLL